MNDYEKLLADGDLRSIGKVDTLIEKIHTQSEFDALFKLIYHADRKIAMRAADGVEKVTLDNPGFLASHKADILQLLSSADNKEVMWHVAQLISRLKLSQSELKKAWEILSKWALDSNHSKIVRVNAVQAMDDLSDGDEALSKEFALLLEKLLRENVPSFNARIRKIKSSR